MKTWAPVVDILETEVDLLVRVELPGMSREDIDIEVTSDQLTVKGERRLAETEKNNFIRLESPRGPFQRSFSIGVPVQPDKVTASHNGGVLEIVIPKAEEVRPKKIDITTG
jgi:HSP20 family protein